MTPKQRLANRVERAVLSSMMLAIAVVMEKALDRLVAGQGRPRSRWGQKLIQRLMPSAQIQHHSQHQPPAKSA